MSLTLLEILVRSRWETAIRRAESYPEEIRFIMTEEDTDIAEGGINALAWVCFHCEGNEEGDPPIVVLETFLRRDRDYSRRNNLPLAACLQVNGLLPIQFTQIGLATVDCFVEHAPECFWEPLSGDVESIFAIEIVQRGTEFIKDIQTPRPNWDRFCSICETVKHVMDIAPSERKTIPMIRLMLDRVIFDTSVDLAESLPPRDEFQWTGADAIATQYLLHHIIPSDADGGTLLHRLQSVECVDYQLLSIWFQKINDCGSETDRCFSSFLRKQSASHSFLVDQLGPMALDALGNTPLHRAIMTNPPGVCLVLQLGEAAAGVANYAGNLPYDLAMSHINARKQDLASTGRYLQQEDCVRLLCAHPKAVLRDGVESMQLSDSMFPFLFHLLLSQAVHEQGKRWRSLKVPRPKIGNDAVFELLREKPSLLRTHPNLR